MSAPFKRHYATARSGNAGASGMRMALDCARSVYEAVDRRMPEAAALANWLRQSAAAFGLPDTAIPDDDPPRRSRRRGVLIPDWRKIGVLREMGSSVEAHSFPAMSQATLFGRVLLAAEAAHAPLQKCLGACVGLWGGSQGVPPLARPPAS